MSIDLPSADAASEASPPRPRWGILGTGWIAQTFVADLQLAGHLVTAVGSRTAQTAEAFASRFGLERAHGSYEALVADPNVDVVYVATPHTRHHDDSALALNACKHVLVEKPFTINAREAQSLVELAAARGLVILEAMWTRWLPHMTAIRRLLADDAIGDVRAVLADHTQKLSDDPANRLNLLELGGGALLDLGVYPISFASDLLGTPEAVQATATLRSTGADAETGILLSYPAGRMATLYTSSASAGPNRAFILGTEGRIEVDSVWYSPTSFRVYDSQDELRSSYESDVPGRGMQFQADEIERLIAAGRLSGEILPLDESVAIMATMDQIREQIGLRYPSE
jgi:predicted dehydrogenase